MDKQGIDFTPEEFDKIKNDRTWLKKLRKLKEYKEAPNEIFWVDFKNRSLLRKDIAFDYNELDQTLSRLDRTLAFLNKKIAELNNKEPN